MEVNVRLSAVLELEFSPCLMVFMVYVTYLRSHLNHSPSSKLSRIHIRTESIDVL